MPHSRVLIVDGETGPDKTLHLAIKDLPLEVLVAKGPAAAADLLARQRFHAVLCDRVAVNGKRPEALHFLQSHACRAPIIMISEGGQEDTVDACFAAGAFDVIDTPVNHDSLLRARRRALLRSELLLGEGSPLPVSRPAPKFPNLVGTSACMADLCRQIQKVAEADTNVCVYGESGTGKELVARAIHFSGPRAKHPLVVFDCAAIPEGLMESEMLGHVRGSFTSAVTDREGVFQLADNGTLILDEIGELPLPLQAKLLRVIQHREFRKVGGKHPIRVNVRIIALTNRDLSAMVAEGKFREDLFYRLEVIPITLPPLRRRKEDIPLLVEHFIEKFNRNNKRQIQGVSSRTMGMLLRYDWPGNVRELENFIERAAVMSETPILDLEEPVEGLGPNGTGMPASLPAGNGRGSGGLKEAERELILRTLESVQGNRTRAADLLGISLRGLHYKLKELKRAGVLKTGRNGAESSGYLAEARSVELPDGLGVAGTSAPVNGVAEARSPGGRAGWPPRPSVWREAALR